MSQMSDYEQQVLAQVKNRRRSPGGRNTRAFLVWQVAGTVVFGCIHGLQSDWFAPELLLGLWTTLTGCMAIMETVFIDRDMHHLTLLVFGGMAAFVAFLRPPVAGLCWLIGLAWAQQRLTLSPILLGHVAQLLVMQAYLELLWVPDAVG